MHVKNINKNNSTAGFTLLELSIVVFVSIMLTMGIIQFFEGYKTQQDHETSRRAITNAQTAIGKFYEMDGRYPCPARRDLSPGDANYGKEDCSITSVAGARDTNSDGNDPVLIGMLPMRATVTPLRDPVTGIRPLPYEVSLPELVEDNEILNTNITDAWGNVPQYAVTELLTKKFDKDDPAKDDPATTFDPYRGAIRVVDENGRDTGGSDSDAHYVVLSAGSDGMGAKNWSTGTVIACDDAYNKQKENCKTDDAVFVSGLRATSADKDSYYDDYFAFATTVPMTLWSKESNNGISTVTSGSVGIGNTTPADNVKLEIGDFASADAAVRAESSLKVDRSTFSDEICDASNPASKCFSPESLMNIGCSGNGQYMRGVTISSDKELESNCETINLPTNYTCPDGGYLRGFSTDGEKLCVAALPIRLETKWIGTTNEGNPTTMNSECGTGWTTTEITDNYDKSDDLQNAPVFDPLHSLSEKTPGTGKKTQLCMRTTDARVIVTSTWTTGSCPGGFANTGVRDNAVSGAENVIHNLTENTGAATNEWKWCLKLTGKGATIETRWTTHNKRYPDCASDEAAVLNARNDDRNLNANVLSGSYQTLCAKLIR